MEGSPLLVERVSSARLRAIWNDPEALLEEYTRVRDPQIPGRLVVIYEVLARSLAVRFENRGWTTTEDLMQVARLGLLTAIERFRPERGYAFCTFAVPTIVGFIKHYLRDCTWGVRVPRRLRELGLRLRLERQAFEQRLGRSPTMGEIAAATGVDEEELVRAMDLERGYQFASLNVVAADDEGDDYSPRADRLGVEDPALEAVDRREAVRAALLHLDERQRSLLRYRFYAGMTQAQVAVRLGISQMHVCRLERKALEQLRSLLV